MGLMDAVAQAKTQGNPAVMVSGWVAIGRVLGLMAPEGFAAGRVSVMRSGSARLNTIWSEISGSAAV